MDGVATYEAHSMFVHAGNLYQLVEFYGSLRVRDPLPLKPSDRCGA